MAAPAAGATEMFARIKERKWAETLRPVDSFVQLDNFRRPRNVAELSNRVELNVEHFMTNYVLFSLVVFTLAVLTRPTLFMVFAAVGAIMWYAVRVPEVRVGKHTLKGQEKLAAASVLSAGIIFIFAGTTLCLILSFCLVCVLAHAGLHRTPDIVDDDNSIAMEAAPQKPAKAAAPAPPGPSTAPGGAPTS